MKMQNNCMLKERNGHCDRKCEHCGWNPQEAKYRKKLLAENGLTPGRRGLKRLIITREESEEQ